MNHLMTKTNKMTVPPANSDQPGHPSSLIRVFAAAQWVAKDPSFLSADSKDSDQTGRMPSDLSLRWAHMPFCWFFHEAAHMFKDITIWLKKFHTIWGQLSSKLPFGEVNY